MDTTGHEVRDAVVSGRAWQVVSFGDATTALRLRERTWGAPPIGELLVRVSAAGAGFPDLMMTRGQFPGLTSPPFGLGEEVVGEVVAVPDGSRLGVGERVMGITAFARGEGGYGDYAYVRADSTVRAPAVLSDEQAAGFMIGFRTAHAGLVERVPVQPGQVLVVLGAAGSTGITAVQLGKALGATVIAVAGGEEKTAFCRRVGADHVIDHRRQSLPEEVARLTGGRGADVVYDPVGGDLAGQALRSLRRYGRIAVVGLASGATVALSSMDLLLRNVTAAGVFAGGFTAAEQDAAWTRLLALAEAGRITVPVGAVVEFEDVPGMVRGLASPPPGKTVVRVSRD